MQFTLKNVLRTLLSFALAAAFLYFAFRGTNFPDLWRSLKNANYLWVALCVPFIVLSFWLRAIRWEYLLAPVKENISRRNLFSALSIGYAINNLLPRVGEFVRPVMLARQEKISRSAAFGTVVIERILDFLTFYFITCITLFMYPNALDPFVDNAAKFRPLLFGASLGGFAVFMVLFFKAEAFVRLLARLQTLLPVRYRPRVTNIVESFTSGFGVAKMRNKLAGVFIVSLLLWTDYALLMYIPFFAFPSLSKLGLGASVVLLVITSIAWVLPAPGAVGTYHSFLTAALGRLYGIDAVTALSFAIITHELGYLVIMVMGGYYFFKDHLTVSDLEKDAEAGAESAG